MSDIKVPPLGESVTEATVGQWHKKVGDAIAADELLVELETDKITLEVNSECEGVLESIAVDTDATVVVGDKLGSIKAGVVAVKKKTEEKPESKQVEKPQNIASPAAGKIAKETKVDLATISGSGKDGRITKGDVLASQGAQSLGQRTTEKVRMTKLRQKIAERLKESQNTAAILTTFNEVDMTNIMSYRNKFKDSFLKKHDVKLGFMSFFVKAATQALQEIPDMNAQIQGDEIIYHKYCDVSVAVGTEKGLVVPVLRDADQMSFAQIEAGILSLAKKARDGKLTMEDLTGGTFSITNGGVYGSLLSTPIINPPQSGILGMHSINERPMVVDGEIKIRPMMYLALSYDHRIVDGKGAVTFLVRMKEMLESPERLLFEV